MCYDMSVWMLRILLFAQWQDSIFAHITMPTGIEDTGGHVPSFDSAAHSANIRSDGRSRQ